MSTQYDLVIIGSGSVGAAAGYYSAKIGLKVLMIDEFTPPHQQASHHGQTRIMRQAYGEGAHYVPMLLRAQTLWLELKALNNDLQALPIYDQCGVLNAAPEGTSFLNQSKKSAKEYGIETQSFDAQALQQKWPEINVPNHYEAILEPNAGVLYSENIIQTYLDLSKQLGAEHCFNCKVLDIQENTSGVMITTVQGVFFAKKCLVSAGTWVKSILADLPVTPIRRVFAWHQADGRFSHLNQFPAFTIEDEQGEAFYGFPAVDNALKIGKHIDWEPLTQREELLPFGSKITDGSVLLKFLKQFLPGVGGCLMGKACSYDMTEDGHFIIDYAFENKNVLVITGLSGHGFKFASVLGEIVSLFANNSTIPYDLSFFTKKRFDK